MADASDEESLTSLQEWELDEGVPQVDDPFIQKYMSGRNALIEQEKKQRHDRAFKATMTPIAKKAAKILQAIRKQELKEKWTSKYEESLAEHNDGNLYPGMMFSLARDRAESTELWRILERMPKGCLLHAHMDAMFNIEWLIDQNLQEKGIHIIAPGPLTVQKRSAMPGRTVPPSFQIRYFSEADMAKVNNKGMSIWKSTYVANTPIPIREAQRTFPDDDTTFKKWLASKCRIEPEESLQHHHGLDAIWRRFQSTFPVIEQLLFYEPIFRRAMQMMLGDLAKDGIMYVDLRMAFLFQFFLTGKNTPEQGYTKFFQVWGEEIEKFKKTEAGKNFKGARMIWTIIRVFDNRMIADNMKQCIAIKKKFPQLICGFDCVGQEDNGRTLADLTPLLFWFKKQCAEAGVDIPFFFHAGECLGDGNSTDNNLYDAILLGTRRIGHGYSMFKHPLLIDMVKEKKILIESCPISNEVLRLSSSILSHTLPALLARGVSVSLNNDDPCILGYGKNGLTHDFWQCFMAFDNLGLEGLGTMAENSVKWCAIEDQKQADWIKGINDGYMGKTVKAQMMKAWRTEFEKWCQFVILEYPQYAESDEDGDSEEESEEDEEEDDDE
ncbi:hypothetical protein PMZ80_009219 [Knufia obscura]|uniref:adenosine deaminase n=2 Tax=Knufia TaxID=430999 RepID=A0AAN8IIE8_9EURO|nr:hypothetical protein PMZ80_009219 [Knufia obscura]KAK5949042.1 hypothetical protein OHC33_009963 [Knufia fluminis]